MQEFTKYFSFLFRGSFLKSHSPNKCSDLYYHVYYIILFFSYQREERLLLPHKMTEFETGMEKNSMDILHLSYQVLICNLLII